MTSVAATTSAPIVAMGAGKEPTSASTTESMPLLPAPQSVSDPLSVLFLLQSQNEQMGLQSGTAKVQGLQQERHTALVKEQSAIKAEAAAAKHKSFWDKLGSICAQVAKVAGVVASVAAAVATCGAASPLAAVAVAGAILSTAGFVSSETDVLQKLGVSDKLANILNTAMSVGGSVASLGAGAIAGAWNVVSTTSSVVSGAGNIGSGASGIASGHALAKEDEASADEAADEFAQDNLTRFISHVVQQTQNADDQDKQLLSTIGQTKGMEAKADLAVATGTKG